MKNIKRYSDLMKIKNYAERVEYLKCNSKIGNETFGNERYLNQMLYKLPEWRSVRDKIIVRDNGCDLGMEGLDIQKGAIVHHINPITPKQILDRDKCLFDPENLITVSHFTHNAIHYGTNVTNTMFTERTPNDTSPWKK